MGAAAADGGSRKVRAGGETVTAAAETPATPSGPDPALTGDDMAGHGAPAAPVSLQASPAVGVGAAQAGTYNPGNRQAALRLTADPAGQAAPSCGSSHVQVHKHALVKSVACCMLTSPGMHAEL